MRMIAEKVQAASELGMKVATSALLPPETVALEAVRHYRGKVSANRRRLSRRKRTP